MCVSAILPNVSFKDFNFDFSNFDAWALGIFIVIFALSRIKIKGKKTHPFVLVITSAVLGIIIYGALPLLA